MMVWSSFGSSSTILGLCLPFGMTVGGVPRTTMFLMVSFCRRPKLCIEFGCDTWSLVTVFASVRVRPVWRLWGLLSLGLPVLVAFPSHPRWWTICWSSFDDVPGSALCGSRLSGSVYSWWIDGSHKLVGHWSGEQTFSQCEKGSG